MTALTINEARRIVLSFSKEPSVDEDAWLARFSLRITNGCSTLLSSGGPNPIRISAFLVRPQQPKPYLGDWPRLGTPVELRPGSMGELDLSIPLISEKGKRILVVTLVQEGVMWMHMEPIGVVATAVLDLPGIRPWWEPTDTNSVLFGNIPELNEVRLRRHFSCGERQRPLMLHVETVNTCNLKCVICPYSKMTRAKELMPPELFSKIVRDYAEMGGGDVIMTPSVGDLFLDKLLVSRFEELRQTPAIRSLGFVTNAGNAHVFSDQELSFIVNSCKRINISIYGLDEEENAAMTRRPGRYAHILEQVKRIMRLNRNATIVLAFRLLKENARERADRWMEQNFGKLYPNEVLTEFGNWGGAMDTSVPLPFAGKWTPPKTEQWRRHTGPCYYPALHVKVAVNGDVKFCSCVDYDSTPENVLGNVKNDSLLNIYNGRAAREKWRNGISLCNGCTHYRPITVFTKLISHLESPIENLGV
jgi:MoaA/NifB/PqqE/SkfB family radical SAM enzyme